MWQRGRNTWSDFTIRKIPSVIHVQSRFLPRQVNTGIRRFTQWFMTKRCGTAVVWMSTCVSGTACEELCLGQCHPLLVSHAHGLHIWGEGTVRSPVGLILLMPPSRMQTLGYFIFTRWAANWKKRSVTEIIPGFLQFLVFIRLWETRAFLEQ